MPEIDQQQWAQVVRSVSNAHILQTAAWGELKAAFGWEVVRIANETTSGGAQILFRKLPLGFSMAYLPKGPLGKDWDAYWPEVDALCRTRRAVFLKVEADGWESDAPALTMPPGFVVSPHAIQPRRTILVDLIRDEKDILAAMKQKTRYNIRLALKKGVVVRPSDDLAAFHAMMQVTGGRDGFGVHDVSYYQHAYRLFHPQGDCELLLAEFKGQPLAALMVFAFQGRAWYLFGASSNLQRNLMPTYLLQWEAMRWAKARGCTEYDLWGVPDADLEQLEAEFSGRSDGLWGVYRFKRGFGGQLRRALPAWDRVYRPFLYKLYLFWMSRKRQV